MSRSDFDKILNFCIKPKNVFILQTDQDRAILTKFLTHRVSAESSGNLVFPLQMVFPLLLVANLNFCVKCKNTFISEAERARVILTNFFTHRVSPQSIGNFLQKIFPPLLVAILNFCLKCNNMFVSQTERARVTLVKLLSPRYLQSLLASFYQNRSSATFGGHLEFLRKME